MTFPAENDAGLDIQRHYRSPSRPLCGLCQRWRWTRRFPFCWSRSGEVLSWQRRLRRVDFPEKEEGLHSLNFDSSLWVIFYFMTSVCNSSRPLKSMFVIPKGTLDVD